MTRVLPDTNIIISAIFWSGKPYKVIMRGLKGEYELVTSPEIMDEVITKLRNKFHLSCFHCFTSLLRQQNWMSSETKAIIK